MADESTRQHEEVILGKKFAGEKFSTVRSTEDVVAEQKIQDEHAHPNAVPLSVYCMIRGHHDKVLVAMLEAHTKVRTATLEAFDKIFKSFFGVPVPEPADDQPSDPDKEV